MTTTTSRHRLPLPVPGQAQKEMFHNESLAIIDALLGAAVEAVGTQTPPAAPFEGQSWILGASPGGAWAGQDHALASWTTGGWRFAAATLGMRATVRATGMEAAWDGTQWRTGELKGIRVTIEGQQVVGPRQPAIAGPAGGATIDIEARTALAAALGALKAHGMIA